MHETTHFSYESGTVNITTNSESLFEVAATDFRFDNYKDFVEAGFTPKELSVISAGQSADITFNLTISADIENEELKSQLLSGKEKEEKNTGMLTEGLYMEMSASKAVGDAPSEPISTLSSDAVLEIDIPLYLRAKDRTYYVLINNMGDCVLLNDLDNEPDTIRISTHNLTTGILLYQDPLDALEGGEAEHFQLQGRHFLWGGIVLLLGLWFFITHLHKKNM